MIKISGPTVTVLGITLADGGTRAAIPGTQQQQNNDFGNNF